MKKAYLLLVSLIALSLTSAQEMKNSLFLFNIPEGFTLTKEAHTCVRYENKVIPFNIQSPFLEVSLSKTASIKTQKGEHFLKQYEKWTEGFKSKVILSEEKTLNGYTAYEVHAETDAKFQGEHYLFQYRNICLLLDADWCIDIQVVFETKDKELFSQTLNHIVDSLKIQGNAEDWLQAQANDTKESGTAYQKTIQSEEPKDYQAPPFQVPENEKDYIQIGDFPFHFIQEKCTGNCINFSKNFLIQLSAKTEKIAASKEAGLTEYAYDQEDGEIQLSVDFRGIYKNGVPSGEFNFKEGKTGAPQFITFWNRGIPLDFYGKVTLKEGWVGIKGILKKPYQEEPNFPIKLAKKLSLETIDWTKYYFNYSEALQASPALVKQLSVPASIGEDLPPELFTFTNLENLSISAANQNDPPKLKTIPNELGLLTSLKELTIQNTLTTRLPDSLAELRLLEKLYLNNNKLEQLPESLFSLPKLQYLWVSNNALTSLPETVNLPTLSSLDLSENKLTSLPSSIVSQPLLRRISLKKNPWNTLPEEINEIENIELSIKDKIRLLDYTYKGADGKGLAEWNNDHFIAIKDPKLKKTLDDAIKGTALEKYQSGLEKLALNAVCLNTTEEDHYKKTGNTRFGGLPDLPKGFPYPQWQWRHEGEKEEYHHLFIAQLNLESLAPLQDYLPRKGMLYFFIEETENFTPKVIFHPSDTGLISAKELEKQKLSFNDSEDPYSAYHATAKSYVSLPSFYADHFWYTLAKSPELANLEDYDHPDNDAVTDVIKKKLGSVGVQQEWNNTYYADQHHSINGYVFTQNESPQEQAALKLKGKPEDWVTLLKVTSDHHCGFSFWDAGELFFIIHKSDLVKGDFSNIYASIESS